MTGFRIAAPAIAAAVFAAWCAAIPAPALAACLAEDHFDGAGDTPGAAPGSWTVVAQGTGTSIEIADTLAPTPRISAQSPVRNDSPAIDGTGALWVFDAGTSADTDVQLVRDHGVGSVVTYEFWIWFPERLLNDATDDDSLDVVFDDPGTPGEGVRLSFVGTSPQNSLIWWQGNPSEVTTIATLDAQTWYRLRVVADAPNDLGDITLYDRDGLVLASATGLRFTAKSPSTSLSRMEIRTFTANTANAYFDAITASDGGTGCPAYTPPAAPSLDLPMDSARFPSTTPTLSWTAPGGPFDFKVQWATDPHFTANSVRRESRVSETGFTIGTEGGQYAFQSGDALAGGQVYWWRVAAFAGDAHSEWSTARSFTVNTDLARHDWYQRDAAQFARGTLDGVDVTDTTFAHDELRVRHGGTANLSIGSVASASSASFPASGAVDEDLATFWQSGAAPSDATPEWLRVDLGSLQTISGFEISATYTVPRNTVIPYRFQVLTSTNGCASFQTTYPSADTEFVNREPTWGHALAENETADCVELRIKEVTGGSQYVTGVEEFRVWDAGSVATGTWTGPPIAFVGFEDPKDGWAILFWNGEDPAAAGVEVALETSSDGSTWAATGMLSSSANGVFDLSGLDAGSHPFLRPVITFTKGSTAVIQAVSAAVSPGPTAAPVVLSAREWKGDVQLRWWVLDESGVSRYRVHRRGPGEPEFQPVPGLDVEPGSLDGTMAEHETLDSGVLAGSRYEYRVELVESSGDSSFSDVASVELAEARGSRRSPWACRATAGESAGLAGTLLAAAAAVLLFRAGTRRGSERAD